MQLIYVKDIDKSVLYQGFTIKTALLEQFTEQFGKLGIGESRNISIIFDGQIYSDIQVTNQNFDRNTYPDHPEMYQVRYSPKSAYAVALRNSFQEIAHFVEEKQRIKDELKKQGLKTPNIQVPEEIRGSLSFYVTADANIWEAIPTYVSERSLAKQEIIRYSMNEMDYEQMLLKDEGAYISEEQHFVKVRKVDQNVCKNLKSLYQYRCQICGELITAPYGGDKHVIDAHHIIPFTQSLDNNFSNIMILCPNHHRIVHAYNPHFSVQKKEYVYPNGLHEKLKLNLHL